MIKLAPSILSADFSKLGDELSMLEAAGADWAHIDVMDGSFVPNITIGAPVVASLRKVSNLFFDVHLMISNPEKHIDDFVKAGADMIVIHAEATSHLHRVIQMIKNEGVRVGVALNPATPLSVLEHVISDLDLVLIMCVNPGFGGQKFIEACYDKLDKLFLIRKEKGLHFDIQVDGGITLENIEKVARYGANVIVAGSAVFNAENPREVIETMKKTGVRK